MAVKRKLAAHGHVQVRLVVLLSRARHSRVGVYAQLQAQARGAAYAAADRITFEGRQLRRDIALRAVERTTT